MRVDSHETTIDEPASPYTVIAFGSGDGIVKTHRITMSIDDSARLFLAKFEAIDWAACEPLIATAPRPEFGQHREDIEELLDLAALMAEINLYQARALWRMKAPLSIGLPRMLMLEDESEELHFLDNLAQQRTLTEGELAEHLMMSGEFMSRWAQARRHF